MKYKYVFNKDNDTGQLIIRENAELSKEVFSIVCESFFDLKQIEEAMAEGYEAAVAKMRTQNFFPPANFLERIFQGVSELIASDDQSMAEVQCDDTEFLTKSLSGPDAYAKLDDDEEEESDDFIDDDLPDDFDDDVKPNVSESIDIDDDMMEEEDD